MAVSPGLRIMCCRPVVDSYSGGSLEYTLISITNPITTSKPILNKDNYSVLLVVVSRFSDILRSIQLFSEPMDSTKNTWSAVCLQDSNAAVSASNSTFGHRNLQGRRTGDRKKSEVKDIPVVDRFADTTESRRYWGYDGRGLPQEPSVNVMSDQTCRDTCFYLNFRPLKTELAVCHLHSYCRKGDWMTWWWRA